LISEIPKKFKTASDPKFLKLFEKRILIFMEDGTDLQNFSTDKDESINRMAFDINRYLVKYDYSIAKLFKPEKKKQS
jgi:hypothetical protein